MRPRTRLAVTIHSQTAESFRLPLNAETHVAIDVQSEVFIIFHDGTASGRLHYRLPMITTNSVPLEQVTLPYATSIRPLIPRLVKRIISMKKRLPKLLTHPTSTVYDH
jgi:hypothetical protein